MSVIFTADLHLNEHPRDEYRWGLFEWLKRQKADELVIGGDLTDAKDRHSAKLVNCLYSAIIDLEPFFKIIVYRGNHDYVDPNHPFFEFLGNQRLNTQFIKTPTVIELSIGKATIVPAGVKWDFKLHEFPYTFTHATFSGAKAENGTQLTGVDPRVLDGYEGHVYSGDIHVPQRIGKKITYVGAPYHTRFGDSFDPRILLISDKGKESDLYFPAPYKHTFIITKPDDLYEEKTEPGDHVKVRCLLRRSEYTEWSKYKERIREIAEEKEWLLFGTEPVPLEVSVAKEAEVQKALRPDDLIVDYVSRHKASDEHIRIGKELLKL